MIATKQAKGGPAFGPWLSQPPVQPVQPAPRPIATSHLPARSVLTLAKHQRKPPQHTAKRLAARKLHSAGRPRPRQPDIRAGISQPRLGRCCIASQTRAGSKSARGKRTDRNRRRRQQGTLYDTAQGCARHRGRLWRFVSASTSTVLRPALHRLPPPTRKRVQPRLARFPHPTGYAKRAA